MGHPVEAFPLAKQGTIQNNPRVIGIATNTPMVLNCVWIVVFSGDAITGCSIKSYPGPKYYDQSFNK